jgi:flagellar basal-body rod modification protein FlgD
MSVSIPTGFTPVSSIGTSSSTTANGVNSTGANGTTGANHTSLDSDDFLQLLVAQLKYQDPTSPMDSSQFMTQTAQYQQVEQMNSMTTATQSVLALQQGMAASNLVGKTVQYTLADGTTGSGTVDSASFGVVSSVEPTLRINNQDISLSSVTTVGAPR